LEYKLLGVDIPSRYSGVKNGIGIDKFDVELPPCVV